MTIRRLLARLARAAGVPIFQSSRRILLFHIQIVPPYSSFLTHHVANISTAIQADVDAQIILNASSSRMLRAIRMGSCKVCEF